MSYMLACLGIFVWGVVGIFSYGAAAAMCDKYRGHEQEPDRDDAFWVVMSIVFAPASLAIALLLFILWGSIVLISAWWEKIIVPVFAFGVRVGSWINK